jgi:hypothetical protein
VVAHACNLRRLREEDVELKASLGYIVDPLTQSRKKKILWLCDFSFSM